MEPDSERATLSVAKTPENFAASLLRIASLVGSRAGGTALMFLFTILLLRVASQDEFGLTMSGMAYMVLASVALTLNVEAGAIRYMIGYKSRSETGRLAGFAAFNMRLFVALSVLLAAALAFAIAFNLLDVNNSADRVLIIALLAAPLPSYINLLTAQATAMNAVVRGVVPLAFGHPTALCVLLVAYVLSGQTISAEGLMLLTAVAFAITAAAQRILLRRVIPMIHASTADMDQWRDWIRTGLFLAPQVAHNNYLKQIAIAASGLTLSASQTAVFALSMSLLALMHFAMKAVDIAYSPSLSDAIQAGDSVVVRMQLRRMARIKTTGFVLGAALLFLLIDWFLGLFGQDYDAARAPALALLLLPATEVLFGPTGLILNVSNNARSVFMSSLLGALCLLAATALGGLWFGAAGAAWGCGLGCLATRWLQREFCLRFVGVDPFLFSLFNGRNGLR